MLLHVNLHDFINLMDAHGGNYSNEAAILIYEWLESVDESWIFDPIIVRSDFIEADTDEIVGDSYVTVNQEEFEEKDYDEQLEILTEELKKETNVLGKTSNGLVFMAF